MDNEHRKLYWKALSTELRPDDRAFLITEMETFRSNDTDTGVTAVLNNMLPSLLEESAFLASGGFTTATPAKGLLESIFSLVGTPERPEGILLQKVCPLTPAAYTFPIGVSGLGAEPKQASPGELLRTAARDMGPLNDGTLLSLIRKLYWCIPASQRQPDVSRYELNRISAAIALCLYDFLQSKPKAPLEDRSESRFLLLAADLTGIQDYIYNVSYKGAARSLKGRSFFLQQLLDGVASWLLDRFDLPPANLLFNGGGNFYVLAPLTERIQSVWRESRSIIEEQLLNAYQGELGVAFGETSLCGSDFLASKTTGMAAKWDQARSEVERSKRRKFESLLDASFFEPYGPAGRVVTCDATGRYLCTTEGIAVALKQRQLVPEDDPDRFISREQAEARRLGERLRNAQTVLTATQPAAFVGGFDVLGIGSFAFQSDSVDGVYRAHRLNDDDLAKLPARAERGWRLYGGNWTLEGDFSDVAAQGIGVHQLGVLRMDVDNLGRLFKSGLGEEATLPRIVQLSGMLDFFFSGLLNRLGDCTWDLEAGVTAGEQGEHLGNRLQIVYSGGDDLFIVGVWHILPDVARWIRKEFRRFTGDNPNLGLSGGIALFPGKFPLLKAAREAGEAEDEAKKYKRPTGKEKDALCFLGTPMSWRDVEVVREQVMRLCTLMTVGAEGHTMPRSILGLLQKLFEEHRQRKLSWRWHARYGFQRAKGPGDVFKRDLDGIAELLFREGETDQPFIDLLGVTARWAELLTRQERKHA